MGSSPWLRGGAWVTGPVQTGRWSGTEAAQAEVIRTRRNRPFRASLVAQLVKNLPAMRETWVRSLGWEDPLEKGRLPNPVFGLENSTDCTVHGVAKSRTQLSDFHFPGT